MSDKSKDNQEKAETSIPDDVLSKAALAAKGLLNALNEAKGVSSPHNQNKPGRGK